MGILSVLVVVGLLCILVSFADPIGPRPHIEVRGIYGGVPKEFMTDGQTLSGHGLNAVFMHSGSLDEQKVSLLHDESARVFAEFNSMHYETFLVDNPDAAPIGVDGKVCPPPHDWQGVCPTHPGYRENRMQTFRSLLTDLDIDGIWLDYHHSHASWERAEPDVPDTCFCERCVSQFRAESGINVDAGTVILRDHHAEWVAWRLGVFNDWVREYRSIIDETKPEALFGTFHCPWTDDDRDGARINKLAIDLRAQAEYIDVFSIMPYHARFGHHDDVEWISRQVTWLGKYLGIEGKPGERHRIWPIVQLSDWGQPVDPSEVRTVLEHATRPPATGVTIFAWGGIARSAEKLAELSGFYREVSS